MVRLLPFELSKAENYIWNGVALFAWTRFHIPSYGVLQKTDGKIR
jgi:hypothetical protein